MSNIGSRQRITDSNRATTKGIVACSIALADLLVSSVTKSAIYINVGVIKYTPVSAVTSSLLETTRLTVLSLNCGSEIADDGEKQPYVDLLYN